MDESATARYPMDFDADDFWHGAGCAWGCFLLLLLVVPSAALLISGGIGAFGSGITYLLYIFGFGLLVSGAAVLVFSPLVWWAARGLRRARSIPVHLAVHAGLGTLIGLIMSLVVGMLLFHADPGDVLSGPWSWVLAAATAVSIAVGWGRAAWRARLSSAPDLSASR